MGRARRSLALVAIAGLALFAAATASAQGPPIVNETEHFANEPDVFVDVNPCDPSQEVEVTSSDTGVIHFTLFADGTVHITGTVRSIVSVDVLPTDGIPDATGRTVVWFGSNGKLDPDTGGVRERRVDLHVQRARHLRRRDEDQLPPGRSRPLRRDRSREARVLQGEGALRVGRIRAPRGRARTASPL